MIARIRALLVSPATYPLGTFWIVAMVVLPLVAAATVAANVGVGILTGTAMALVSIAFKRDLDSMHAQHHVLVARVQQLTEALTAENIPIPPVHSMGVHRKARP